MFFYHFIISIIDYMWSHLQVNLAVISIFISQSSKKPFLKDIIRFYFQLLLSYSFCVILQIFLHFSYQAMLKKSVFFDFCADLSYKKGTMWWWKIIIFKKKRDKFFIFVFPNILSNKCNCEGLTHTELKLH